MQSAASTGSTTLTEVSAISAAELAAVVQSQAAKIAALELTDLVDVLQRISEDPAGRVTELTPRLWKVHFAANPLRSDISDFPV
jgi:transposase